MHSRLKHALLQTPVGQIIVLTVVMLSLYSAAALCIWWMQGPKMLGIAAALASLCYVTATIALLGESFFSKRHQAVLGMYWAVMIRSGVPLIAVIVLKVLGGSFAEPPAVCHLVAFYFGALIVQVVASYYAADDPRPAAAQSPLK